MKYATEMDLGAMIYITKFHEDWPRRRRYTYTQTYRHTPSSRSHKPADSFSKYRKQAKNCPVHWWENSVV
jgi:hypothetical protein